MNVARALVKVGKQGSARQPIRTYTSLERVKELQRLFCADDGVPVHLKRGMVDRVLYQLTMGLCIVATGASFYSIYTWVYPTKKPQ
uniref:Cytochrome c oxidase subunit VIIa 2 n=1 Tax=Argas monolakensis TaxID=34602 RepID=Q09JJ2_ARGMO|nr:cytochrome c oxidase subunit VIIa 2 [Argas monolakensis]